MKKLIPLLLLATGLFGSAMAQKNRERADGPPPPPRQEQQRKGGMSRLPLSALDLTDAQKESFRKQRESFKKNMDALKKEENITVKEWKSRMEKLRKDNQTAMQNILTPDQKAKIKRLREEQQVRQMQSMKKRLDLNDEQVGQIKGQRAATEKQMKTIRENDRLTATEKREAMKKLMREQKDNLEKILTPEQRVKLKDMPRPHQGPNRRGPRPGMRPPPDEARPPKQAI